MNPKNSLSQFVKDGLVGGALTLILFGIWSVGDWGKLWIFVGAVWVIVGLTGFFSLGIGGRFLDNITTRWSWLKPLLIISIIPWITGLVVFQIMFSGEVFDWGMKVFAPTICAGAGFLIAGLVGILFNPTKRFFRLIIGANTVAVDLIFIIVSIILVAMGH